jgi:flagellar motor switch protein FliN/FliY
MSETAQAGTENPMQSEETVESQAEDKTQVQSVELPEVPEGGGGTATGKLDILLDMDVPVTVVLGATQIPVRRLLQLGPGAVVNLAKPIEAPADLYLKDAKFAEADVVVVDNRFAVRIRKITGNRLADRPGEGPSA